MPDRTKLRIGDKIRLISIPNADFEQRSAEIDRGDANAGWTANTIEQIIAKNPILVINRIDEYGMPWFDYTLKGIDGSQEHSLAIMDDDSWIQV